MEQKKKEDAVCSTKEGDDALFIGQRKEKKRGLGSLDREEGEN